MQNKNYQLAELRHSERGLTFIEIVIVLAVVALLAGVIAPSMMSVTKDAQASKIISTYEVMRGACVQHYAHTGALPIEYSHSSKTAAQYHQLAMTQTTAGWKGPYIDHPLGVGDNPFGGTINVYNSSSSVTTYAASGFDMNGDATNDITGAASILVLGSIPVSTAEAVDAAIDRGVGGTWSASGRVEFSSGVLTIYLIQP